MEPIWGSKKWQLLSGIIIIFILGYGTYSIVSDIIAGHPIWWYNASFILFALTLLGLLLLVRQGWTTVRNVISYGLNPSQDITSSEDDIKHDRDDELIVETEDDTNRDDHYF